MEELSEALPPVAADFFNNMIKEVGLKLPFEEGCLKEMAGKLEKKLTKEA